MISEQGKAMIKSKLRKENYHVDFEADVMANIHEIKEYTSNLIPNLILQMGIQDTSKNDFKDAKDGLNVENYQKTLLEDEKRKYEQL